jgi:hypothetical protein
LQAFLNLFKICYPKFSIPNPIIDGHEVDVNLASKPENNKHLAARLPKLEVNKYLKKDNSYRGQLNKYMERLKLKALWLRQFFLANYEHPTFRFNF